MTELRLLDLYCGQGGAAMGYHRGGLTVTGVDISPQPRYPFTFHHGDAIEYLLAHGCEYDLIHASPPCQHASAGTRAIRAHQPDAYPDLIAATRDALDAVGVPYVIENVVRSALQPSKVTELCGCMFGLKTVDQHGNPLLLRRTRWFETTFPATWPRPHTHPRGHKVGGVYGAAPRDLIGAKKRGGGYVPDTATQARLLKIDWMTYEGLHQAIPPIYTQWLSRFAIKTLEPV